MEYVYNVVSDFILMMMEFVLVFILIVKHGIYKENAPVVTMGIKSMKVFVYYKTLLIML